MPTGSILTPPTRPTATPIWRFAITSFSIPTCQQCGGLLKPDVVFFGETVPRGRGRRRASAAGRRHAGGRLIADGVLGLPFRPNGDPRRHSDRGGQSGAYSGRRNAGAQGRRDLRVCAVLP